VFVSISGGSTEYGLKEPAGDCPLTLELGELIGVM
jgi:hypothetical protein